MSRRLSGLPSLAYRGVEAPTPPNLTFNDRSPTATDKYNVNIGDLWIVKDPHQLWYLASLAGNTALWLQLYPKGSDGATQFPTDAGTANELAGVLNVFGGTNMNTAGAGNTVTINLDNTVSLSGSLTVQGPVTFDDPKPGVIQSSNVGLLSASRGNDGEVLIGFTGANPVWNPITSTDGSITVTTGPGTIDLKTVGAGNSGGFSAYLSHAGLLPVTGDSTLAFIVFDTEFYDNGSVYDNTTGIFTAPVTGIYNIYHSASGISNGASGGSSTAIPKIGFVVNYGGSPYNYELISPSWVPQSGLFASFTVNHKVTVSLNANDTVRVYWRATVGAGAVKATNIIGVQATGVPGVGLSRYSTFGAYLLDTV